MKFLGPSWKPKIVAIAALLGPSGLYAMLSAARVNDVVAWHISTGVFVLLILFGLYSTKQDGVSNSPTPLAIAQVVVPVTLPTPTLAPIPLAHPVPIVSEPVPDVEPKPKKKVSK
jgi:hypothetical protein